MSNIVNEYVSVLPASLPSTLQQTGVIISQGGTTLTPSTAALPNGIGTGCTRFLSQVSDLTAVSPSAQTITSLTWSSGTVTATVSGGHGYPSSQTIPLTIAGDTATGYNGTFNCTITSTTQFTYAIASNPGTSAGTPTVIDADQGYLLNDVVTYFAQQSGGIGVYVLELGVGDSAHGIASLTTWIQNNIGIVYAYKLPEYWGADATLPALCNVYTGNKAQTYFFFDATSSYWTNFTGMKSACIGAVSPNAVSTESLACNMFAIMINYAPSSIHKVPQSAYTFLYNATPWPINNTNIPTMELNNINYALRGSEGGLSNVILKYGKFQDATLLNNWYAIDWVEINGQRALAYAVILGSNNTQNPLYYNQQGINTLTSVAQKVVNQAVDFGLIGGSPQVQGIPYATYTQTNPNDYANSIYNGLSVVLSTQKGFLTIGFNITFTSAAP